MLGGGYEGLTKFTEEDQIAVVKKVCPKTNKYLKKTKANSALYKYYLGRAYSNETCSTLDNSDLSLMWYKKAADQGNADAQFTLALMYEAGTGVETDHLQAAKLYEEAAKDHIPGAHIRACYMYGDVKDYKKSSACYQKEIDNDSMFKAAALNNLAINYERGRGVPMNKMKAYSLYMQASKNGSPEAQLNLDKLCKNSIWACK